MKTTSLPLIFFSMILLVSVACDRQKKNTAEDNVTAPAIVADSTANSAKNNEQAMKYHEKLMEYFSDDWIERESDPDLYPDYYGGSFIDNSGTFVIAVTGNQEANRLKLADILGGDDFKVETVQYSYRQMMQVMDKIDAFLADNTISQEHPVLVQFAGAYPDVMENRVKVILTGMDQAVISAFKKDISDSPLLVFEKGERPALM